MTWPDLLLACVGGLMIASIFIPLVIIVWTMMIDIVRDVRRDG